ncbi:MAG: TerB family tellurite resistance protein [Methanobacteriota archaeon]|nr:MAG: TerB family tellurite resistance protein [Euryarchaeota archaeon]
MEKAKEDGIITPEEFELIEQVRLDAENYTSMLREATSDGIITDKEAQKLDELKKRILERAELVARIDGTLDDDEKQLLETLADVIKKKYV